MSIKTRILSQSSWNSQKSISESVNTELGLSAHLSLCVVEQVFSTGDFESTSTWGDTLVLDAVGDSSKTITNSVLSLSDGVVVWSLNQDGAGEWVLDTFDESVFVLTEGLLVNELGETEIRFGQIVEGVELAATAGEWDTLTVSLLAAADAHDAGAGEDFEGWWIDTLLIDDDKVLVGALAKLFFEGDDLVNLIVGESTLRLDELLSLVSVGPEESRMDFGLLVLEGYVQAHDIAVLES